MANIPIPPFEYRTLVGGPGNEALFEWVGRWLQQFLNRCGMIGAGIDFLDVGCGCGRLARFLLDEPIRRYEGFDRHPGMIAWCNEALASLDPRFRFHHVAVRSVYKEWDGYEGETDADAIVFRYPAASFDSVLVASVFTHMPLDEVRHYLDELRRVLRPAGRILLSAFFSESAAYRKDEINFFHEPEQFLAAVAAAGFAAQPDSDQVLYGYNHNWYVITHAHAEVPARPGG